MARTAYVGMDEVARKIKKFYIGVPTDIPIYETTTTTNTYDFTYANRAHFFSDNASTATTGWKMSSYSSGGVKLVPNNFGVNSSTATITLTALKNLTNVTIKGIYYTESRYDKITLVVGGTTVLNAVSGTSSTLTTHYTGNLTAGQTIKFTYAKDTSQHATNESSTYFVVDCNDLTITAEVEEIVGYETKEVARKIKKGYIGVDGTARLVFSGAAEVAYTGNFTVSDVEVSGAAYKLYTLTSSGTLTLGEDAEYWMCAAGNNGENGYASAQNNTFGGKGGGGGRIKSGTLSKGTYVTTVGAATTNNKGIGGSTAIGSLISSNSSNWIDGASGGGGSPGWQPSGSHSYFRRGGNGIGDGVSTIPFTKRITSGFSNYAHSPGGGGGMFSAYVNSRRYLKGGNGGSNGASGAMPADTPNSVMSASEVEYSASSGGNRGGGSGGSSGNGGNGTFYGAGGGGGSGLYHTSSQVIGQHGTGYQGIVYLLIPV